MTQISKSQHGHNFIRIPEAYAGAMLVYDKRKNMIHPRRTKELCPKPLTEAKRFIPNSPNKIIEVIILKKEKSRKKIQQKIKTAPFHVYYQMGFIPKP